MSIQIPGVRNKHGATTAHVIAEQIALCESNIRNIQKIAVYRKEREIRDEINRRLRGCHDFLGMAGSRKNGCLYREFELNETTQLVCEHAIPVSGLVSLFEAGTPFEELVFYPVARIAKTSDKKFEKMGLVKTGHDSTYIFSRYHKVGIRIETHEGFKIDTETWSIQQHWELVESTPELLQIRTQVRELLRSSKNA